MPTPKVFFYTVFMGQYDHMWYSFTHYTDVQWKQMITSMIPGFLEQASRSNRRREAWGDFVIYLTHHLPSDFLTVDADGDYFLPLIACVPDVGAECHNEWTPALDTEFPIFDRIAAICGRRPLCP